MRKTVLLWAGGILVGVVVAFFAPTIIANYEGSPTHRTLDKHHVSVESRPISEETFLVVIGRRPERRHLEDPTDHRNSRLAIYQRGEGSWELVRGPLPVRSHSTLTEPPLFRSLEEAHNRPNGRFGYQSVPLGVFTLVEIPWRNDNRAFLISDHGRTDGTISLSEPQEIRSYTVVNDQEADVGFRLEIAEEAIRSSWVKRESALHPTHTTIWSHGDSQGCINLYQPNLPDAHPDREGSPWQQFLGWLDEFKMRGYGHQVVLVIMPWESVSDSTGETLGDSLPLKFFQSVSQSKGGSL